MCNRFQLYFCTLRADHHPTARRADAVCMMFPSNYFLALKVPSTRADYMPMHEKRNLLKVTVTRQSKRMVGGVSRLVSDSLVGGFVSRDRYSSRSCTLTFRGIFHQAKTQV